MKNVTRVYLDMDGTLNVFEDVGIDEVSKPGYMKDRTPIQTMIEAAKLIESNPDMECCILSAVLPYGHSILDKDYWLDKHMPFIPKERRFYTNYGENKSNVLKEVGVSKGDVFVDDYTKNLKEIDQELGNDIVCIKCMNNINDTHKSWNGGRVSINSDARTIADTIIGLHMVKQLS